jgi:hypothetical protein
MMWFACEQPERPPDAKVVWHYCCCAPCRVKAEAQARRFPDDPHVAWLVDVAMAP